MESPDALIVVEHLSRYYGPTAAVRDLSFQVRRGEVLGFLGPNGAGKSTTMQMITGNLAPSGGRVTVGGADMLDEPVAAKARLGYLPEQPPVYKELTVDEYLRFCARLNRIPRAQAGGAVARAKERCGLAHMGRRLIGNLSKGYQQRVGIAQAIIHQPDVVILDEPTVGLDPIQIREIRDLIRELGRDHSVILSTHILPEVQSVCNRVLIINRGEKVFDDSIEALTRRMQTSALVVVLRRPPAVAELEELPGVSAVETLGEGRFRLHHDPERSPAEDLVRAACAGDWGLVELTPERLSLEDVFVNLTCVEPAGEAA